MLLSSNEENTDPYNSVDQKCGWFFDRRSTDSSLWNKFGAMPR